MTDFAADSPPEADLTAGIPEQLNKQTGRHGDHRSVNWDDLTPMMRHFVEVKEQHPHALLLYRVGDFFETFFQDAIAVARELELVLTSKDAGKDIGRVYMAGIPHHALDRYCRLLVEKGFAVAICDQVEDPSVAQGLVRREVTRVITPGTVLEEGLLQARRNNFLAAVVLASNHWGLAYADISTGEFWATQSIETHQTTASIDQLTQELLRLQPSEVLLPTSAPDLVGLLRPGEKTNHLPEGLPNQFCYTLRSALSFSQAEARQRLLQRFQIRSLEGLGCDHLPLVIRAAGGLLAYLEETSERQDFQDNSPKSGNRSSSHTRIPLKLLKTYTLADFLILDYQTRRNLEIIQTSRDNTFHGSLLWALDRTVTAMGGRMLRRWLLQPLLEISAIHQRQAAIQELLDNPLLRQSLQSLLKRVYDLERLAGRAGSGTANARDLLALAESFQRLPDLAALVASARSPYLQALQSVPPRLEQLGHKLHSHLVENPPLSLTEGGMIRSGVNATLDALRQQVEVDQQWIARLEVEERDRTGIANLKVGYNKTFGYYITISRSRADQVPAHYIRKQTLSNEERYITPELKEKEARISTNREEQKQIEYEIFTGLRGEVGEQANLIREVAAAVAAVDVLVGLADIAIVQGYCRPQIVDGRRIQILEGRHPVVEQSIPAGFFVPNDTHLGAGEALAESAGNAPDLVILTGPNASGKSCYLRQVGLIQIMAQVGSFVPARSAILGVCDRVFTRVGAVDDLATGQSTFMVEMNETANILNHATRQSLVLLDEIGRGTATFDGLAIAWAVAEHLANDIQARTIFATHYHELNELAAVFPTIANYQVTVKELPDRIVFLHQVRPGGADRSYGIEAGRLAGLPPTVIQRARQVMGQIEKHSRIAVGLRKGIGAEKPRPADQMQEAPIEQLDIFQS